METCCDLLYNTKHGLKEMFNVHTIKSNRVKFVPGFCYTSSETE
jgi:hypothetical protein